MKARVPLAGMAVLAFAGTALAGDGFNIGAIDAGGVTGSDAFANLTVIGGTIYQNAFGSDFEPNQALFAIAPELEFDSYVAIDYGPVASAPGYDGSAIDTVAFAPGSTGFMSDSLGGAWFVSSGVVASQLNGSTGLHEVFVARITHTGVLTGYLGTTISEDNNVTTRMIGSDLGATFDSDTDAGTLEESYTWVVREQIVDIGGTEYTVSDIYLQQGEIPAPSALGLLGVGGVLAARRRR